MSQILLIISILTNAVANDVCTSRASLIKIDEFFMKQSFSAEVEIDLSNYNDEFRSIAIDADKFATIAVGYDSEAELDDLEPLKLIELSPETNLISITSTHHDYMADCSKINAKILEIQPHLIPAIQAILKKLNLPNVAIKTFNDRLNTLTNLQGDLFKIPTKPTTVEMTKMQDFYALLNLDGSLSYPASDVTETTKIAGLCMKANNVWDRKGPSRQKWLTTLGKMLPTVSQIKQWGGIFTEVINQLPSQNSLYQKMTDKLVLNTPLSLSNIKKFLNKFNTHLKWESSLPSDLTTFLQYIKDFKEIAKLFKRKTALTPTTPSSSVQTQQPPNVNSLPLMSIANIDRERLQRFINLDPSKINITGSIDTIPLYKHEEPGRITAKTSLKQYGETDRIIIYYVKPLNYQGSITTVTHVIGTFNNYLATMVPPSPYDCEIEDQNDNRIKICSGYTTPGLSQLSPEDSLDCGNSLAMNDSEEDFNKCPTTRAPDRPIAHRANCHSSSAVLSSSKPLVIRIYCDTVSKRPIKLDTFPAYLNTDCEIKLLDNRAEMVLLPQYTTKFLQDRTLDVTVVTLSSTNITKTTARSPRLITTVSTIAPVVTTASSSTSDINLKLTDPNWMIPVFSALCVAIVLLVITIICCFCSKLGQCQAVWNKSRPTCCSPGDNIEQSTNCNCCRTKSPKTSGDVLEMTEQIIVRPHYAQSEKEENRPFLAERRPHTPSNKPPASAPAEDEEFYRNVDNAALQRELSKSNHTLAETRNVINNQFGIAAPKPTY